jgi:hypothetical protein
MGRAAAAEQRGEHGGRAGGQAEGEVSRYDNDKIYADYKFDDETSAFDPKGVWVGGCEYYSRTYRCRVPRKMLERAQKTGDHTELNDWLDGKADVPEVWR